MGLWVLMDTVPADGHTPIKWPHGVVDDALTLQMRDAGFDSRLG